jgi:hypothetical protein
MDELEIRDRWRVDLPELSALALRARDGGEPLELLGVGDSSFSIFRGEAEAPGSSTISTDLAHEVSTWTEAGGTSQWEGAAVDGAGRAFVLQEHSGRKSEPSHVFVFDPGLQSCVLVVALRVEAQGGEWQSKWAEDKNARGEALLLLLGGRILIAKQKDPVQFIEFGPSGADAAGFDASQLLDADESFDHPADRFVELEPLASWGVAEVDRGDLDGVNDLAAAEGRLYAISRKSGVIALLEARAAPEEDSIRVERCWRIPDSVAHPEGLAIRDGLLPIVADDVDAEEDVGDPNIFLLSSLSA